MLPSDCLVSHPGHSLGFLIIWRDAVGVYYSPSRLDKDLILWGDVLIILYVFTQLLHTRRSCDRRSFLRDIKRWYLVYFCRSERSPVGNKRKRILDEYQDLARELSKAVDYIIYIFRTVVLIFDAMFMSRPLYAPAFFRWLECQI